MPGEWLAQLPDDLKTNETLTGFETLGDFAKSHLETVGKVSAFDGKTTEYEGKITDLNTRLENSIPRLADDSDDAAKAAYRKALGVPDSADGYEFTKADGVEHDEKMLGWAKDVFHQAGLSAEQANSVSQAWDKFMPEMGQAMADAEEADRLAGVETAETALKEEWKGDFDKNKELTKRGYDAFEKAAPGFKDLLDSVDVKDGLKLGNDPRMLKVFFAIGKAIGDDFSFPSGKPPGTPPQDGKGGLQTIYKDKNPAPVG